VAALGRDGKYGLMVAVGSTLLPLSQQVIAWLMRGLGYDELSPRKVSRGVSRSTLKNAQSGDMIPRAWPDLIDGVLELLDRDPAEHRATLQQALEHWDEMISRLPPPSGLSLAERLHAPLVRAIPEVGIRLGALVASLALATEPSSSQPSTSQASLKPWLWLVEPLDKRFFGKVVDRLLERRFAGMSNEKRKELVERDARDEDQAVAWRTIERWHSGEIEVPNTKGFAALGKVLGEGAEPILRLARLAAQLRKSLCDWIGEDAAAQWFRQVAAVGQIAARFLFEATGMAKLLGWLRAGLDGPHGDGAYANLRHLLPDAESAPSRSELSAYLGRAAACCERGDTTDPVARWAVFSAVLYAYPPLSVQICGVGGNPLLGLLVATSFVRHVGEEWLLRTFMKAVISGDPPLTRNNGTPIRISDAARAAVQRWYVSSLGFENATEDDPAVEAGVMQAFLEAFGPEAFVMLAKRSPSIDPSKVLLDPAVEVVLSDAEVRGDLAMSLARARRLLDAGDLEGARSWIPALDTLQPPLSGAEIAGLVETYAAICHYMLDQPRPLRALLRVTPAGTDLERGRGWLSGMVQPVERLVSLILQIGETTHAQLEALVHALPVAIRVTLLREEVEFVQEGLNQEAVDRLVDQLERCMEHHPTHAHGWALRALWRRLQDQHEEAERAEKQAIHFGAGAVLDEAWRQIENDLGLATEDAGLTQDAG
jgi:hypothetical protein